MNNFEKKDIQDSNSYHLLQKIITRKKTEIEKKENNFTNRYGPSGLPHITHLRRKNFDDCECFKLYSDLPKNYYFLR